MLWLKKNKKKHKSEKHGSNIQKNRIHHEAVLLRPTKKFVGKTHRSRRLHSIPLFRLSRKKIFWITIFMFGLFGISLLVFFIRQSGREHYISPVPLSNYPTVHNDINQRITSQLKRYAIAFNHIDTESHAYYSVFLGNNAEILLSENKDIAEQITSLQFILVRLTMEGRQFRKLDLRFSKPVIVF